MFARVIILALALASLPASAGYLIDGNGGFLLDDRGGKLLVSDNVHTLTFLSTWGTGQSIEAWFDVHADKSAITVNGRAADTSSPVVSTEIVHVLPTGVFVSLALCHADTCTVDWPATAMTAGQANEVLFYLTNAAGVRYGASTRISKPQ